MGVVTGVWVLVGAVVVATAIGAILRRRDGRFRVARARDRRVAEPAAPDPPVAAVTARRPASDPEPHPESLAGELTALGREAGQKATLLQFSTAFCGPCRTTRVVLADVARIVPGVAHVEVDAEDNLELVRRLGIRRTPTVLVLDGGGREISRASGAPPSRAAVIAALGPVATDAG